jgi:integrase
MQKIDSRAFKLFVNSISSEKTRQCYIYNLNKFCEYASLTYEELAKLDTEEIQTKLENWIMEMKSAHLRKATIRVPLAAVEKFLDINRKLYYKKVLHSLLTEDKDLGGGNMPFTNEDIQNMLVATKKLRTKALVLFLASTGTRPQALVDPVLRKKHLVEMPGNCYAVRIYDNTKEGYWSFLTPEARKALDNYLNSRKRNGERITEESPLFANLAKHAKHANMSIQNVYDVLKGLYKLASIERTKVGFRYDKAITYGFRKRFNTILKLNNNVNSNIAEKLMAHKRGLDGAYLTPTREECFAEFEKAIKDLTVDDKERLKVQTEKQKQKLDEFEDILPLLKDPKMYEMLKGLLDPRFQKALKQMKNGKLTAIEGAW